jgi:2-keto-3-deoxy-L-rhamnonate aldolase RhmA
MIRKELKEKLNQQKAVFAGWTSIGHPQITEMIARSGVDFIGIDLEHSTISQEQAQRIIAACHANAVVCLPRVASHDPESIRRLLDSGADGILVPTVETPAEVDKLIEVMKYPPSGKRGYGVARAQGYGNEFKAYTSNWNQESILILQIESVRAVKNIEALLGFEEVDGVMIGPYDLSGSLGIPGQIDSELVEKESQKVVESCKRHHKACGIHIVDPSNESIRSAIDNGYTFLALSSDVFMLQKWGQETKRLLSQFC